MRHESKGSTAGVLPDDSDFGLRSVAPRLLEVPSRELTYEHCFRLSHAAIHAGRSLTTWEIPRENTWRGRSMRVKFSFLRWPLILNYEDKESKNGREQVDITKLGRGGVISPDITLHKTVFETGYFGRKAQ